jgi:fumarate reductase subunit D
VFVELAWSVLRPIRASLPRFTIVAVAALILAVGAAIWPFAALPGLALTSPLGQLIGRMQQTVAILRILVFLLLAGFSQLLSIGFRDRELQVATGMGFYSLVSLGTALLSTHQETVNQYKHLNQFVIGSFLCSLLYWIVSFAQKEAERREFTPQMQNLLLAVAGVARAERSALTNSSTRHKGQ